MKIADGIEMLEISSTINGEANRIYPTLVWDEKTVMLVDTGFPGQLELIRAAMEAAGVSFARLNAILLTHHDIDHIGCVNAIRAERATAGGRVRVLCHRVEKPYVQGDLLPLKLGPMEADLTQLQAEPRAMYDKLKGGFAVSFAPVDQVVEDGNMLRVGSCFKVVFTPGHTLGHICLYHEESKTLIAGDALRVKDGVLTQAPARMNYDMELYRESLGWLAKLEIENVICYHGGLYQGKVSEKILKLIRE